MTEQVVQQSTPPTVAVQPEEQQSSTDPLALLYQAIGILPEYIDAELIVEQEIERVKGLSIAELSLYQIPPEIQQAMADIRYAREHGPSPASREHRLLESLLSIPAVSYEEEGDLLL